MRPQPYRFYRIPRACSECGKGLAVHTPLTRKFTAGLLGELGVSCFCPACGSRFRARNPLRFGWVAWLGPPGRWLWWKTASLELTLRPELP
ncbi:MAG: hypothetical protein HYZ90_01580 [Candidatus Omnitrophica bacterium]|nr:hypothetical protein [Candidatus Omnitrophota bacterium]